MFAPFFAKHVAYARQLSRLVGEVEGERAVTAALDESSGDDAVENCHVDVSA